MYSTKLWSATNGPPTIGLLPERSLFTGTCTVPDVLLYCTASTIVIRYTMHVVRSHKNFITGFDWLTIVVSYLDNQIVMIDVFVLIQRTYVHHDALLS